ncbi:hypothetical protein [Psychroserpens algicola]|uniref:WG repeat-containing protein n=1 Tax=Psychroserpens algicola TaxID=1719034 RepID=A0ABT0HA46_9FLAO|nr:hypothetical protein [Psychroserpens algicola]MCK8481243.1 hypothetical protein [Psychroserpens algicola]
MKSLTTLLLLFISMSLCNAQTDLEIGSVYIKRAEQSYLDNEMGKAREYFDKAITYIKEINDSRVARIGTILSFDIKDYTKAKILAQRYFELEQEKTSEDYFEMLELYVTIDEAIKQRAIEEERNRLEQLKLAKEKRRLDSLTNLWHEKSQKFYIEIDSIGDFNKYNLAIYKSKDYLGIMDDYGRILMKADTFPHAIAYDGYIIFMNDLERPTRLFCFNSKTQEKFLLPDVTAFNPQAYDYGEIMLPRANGLLVTYPKNCKDVVVFNLNSKEFRAIEDKKELLKNLKKNDIIDKYDKDLNVRIEKQWYAIGNSVGGNFYALFNEDKELHGFISASDGRVYTSDYYSNFGGFCDNKFQVIENGKTIWMDAEGIKYYSNENLSGAYSGTTKFVKTDQGKFKILQKDKGKDVLIKGNETLHLLEDFIEQRSK